MFILLTITMSLHIGVFIIKIIVNNFYEGSENISETLIIVLLLIIIILLFGILQKLDAKDIGKE